MPLEKANFGHTAFMLSSATTLPVALPIAQIQTQWSGATITDSDYDTIKPNAFFTLPFLFFNFLPEMSLKKGEVFQFWLGFQFLTANLSLNISQLHAAFQRMRFQFLAVLNSHTKNCVLKRNLSAAMKLEIRQFGQYLAEPEYTDVLNSPYHFNFLFQEPFLLPTRCLLSSQKNTLLLSWSPQDDARFTSQTGKIRLDFLLPSRWEADRLQLPPNQRLLFTLPTLTWFRFRLGKPTLIDTLANHRFTIRSELKTRYPFQTPFDGLFELAVEPWIKTSFFERLLLKSRNLYQWYTDWFSRFRFQFSLLPVSQLKTIIQQHSNSNTTLPGKLVLTTVPNSDGKLLFQHFLVAHSTKNNNLFPFISNQINPQGLFLSSQTTPHLHFNLQTTLVLQDKINLALKWNQPIQFDNLWNQSWILVAPENLQPDWILTIFYCLNFPTAFKVKSFDRLAGKNCV